jgi:ABC-2 type transport system permease protein
MGVKKIVKRYRYSVILLRELVKTDFKLRYQNSILGYVWSLLRPLFIFLILYMVFVRFLKVNYGVPHPEIYLLVAIVLWNFFAEVTNGSVSSIVGRGDLLRKINFPRYVIVFASSFAALINLGLNFIVVAFFCILSGVSLKLEMLFIPLLVLELFILSMGIGFFLSAAYVRFRDTNFIWEVIMQAAFYATPILYPLSVVPMAYAKIIMLSPLAQIIQDVRFVIIGGSVPTIASVYGNPWMRAVPIAITLIIAVFASLYFRARSKYFAEEV